MAPQVVQPDKLQVYDRPAPPATVVRASSSSRHASATRPAVTRSRAHGPVEWPAGEHAKARPPPEPIEIGPCKLAQSDWRNHVVTRISAVRLMGFDDDGDDGPPLTSAQRIERDACAASFLYFLKYWQFRNREGGDIASFVALWEGQLTFATKMVSEPWIFALKAGKLGFSEVECAFDAWVALFRQPNARVQLFSRDAKAAQDLLGYIRFGLMHVPAWLGLPIMADEPGGDTMSSLKLDVGTDDVRVIVSYAAGPHVSIDQSATHVHVDELARMLHPALTWSSIQSTVAPQGSCHIVTRGADDNFISDLWEAAESGDGKLEPCFAPWSARPREVGWRDGQAGTLSAQQVAHFAPETPADALAGDETSEYIPAPVWDLCHDPLLQGALPGGKEEIVLGIDAGVTGDCFAIVAVTRHPSRCDDVAIRNCKIWRPSEHGGRIDFDEVERFIWWLARGGCLQGHPAEMPLGTCGECIAKRFGVPRHNIVHLTSDRYQMESITQRIKHQVWCRPFPQGQAREMQTLGCTSSLFAAS